MTETELKKGDRVRHPAKPEWGVGQLLEDPVDGRVSIFFVEGKERRLNLDYVQLIRVEEEEGKDTVLDHIPSGRQKLSHYRTLEELVEHFLNVYPEGFQGEAYEAKERKDKLAAAQLLASSLGEADFRARLQEKDFKSLVKDALAVLSQTKLVFPSEKKALAESLKAPGRNKVFAEALYRLLYGEEALETRFMVFARALYRLKCPKWSLATYYLFLHDPKQCLLLKPTVTRRASQVCGFDLAYKPELNWETYRSLLEYGQHLKSHLKELKPRDMIDVQAFMWCAAKLATPSARRKGPKGA